MSYVTWIDVVIVGVFFYALLEGWRRGCIALLAAFLSFLGSLWLAVRYHSVIGNFFMTAFGLSQTWSLALGYLVVGSVSQIGIEMLMLFLLSKVKFRFLSHRVDAMLGAVASGINVLAVSAFVLLLILALPIRGTVKNDIRASVLGRLLVTMADTYGGQVRSSLQDFARTATEFLTVEPGSDESVRLDIPSNWTNFRVDSAAAAQLVGLVNSERASRGLSALKVDPALTEQAEEKSRDMFARRYFSHYDPDGRDAADRLTAAGIPYSIVGENLAYAPDVLTAHQGLMDSEGHRKNILEEQFHTIGIGVIDGGIYGKMFTQLYTD